MMLAYTVLALVTPLVAPITAHEPALESPAYFVTPLRNLTFESGKLPEPDDVADFTRSTELIAAQAPYAVLSGAGEAWVSFPSDTAPWASFAFRPHEAVLALSAEAGQGARGTLYFPGPKGRDWVRLAFEVPATAFSSDVAARAGFLRAKAETFVLELERGSAGAAWFRHRMNAALDAAGLARGTIAPRVNFVGTGDLQDTYDLFTGGRALSENLQLERVIDGGLTAERMIAIDTLEGITTQELDWKKRIEGLHPELDPLAALVPADQHALFFPGFAALLAVIDETSEGGAPVLELLEPRAEDARTFERYERQLCLPLTREVRELGPKFVQSVAITGSDPYLRTGADVAVLFGAEELLPISAFVAAQQGLALASGAKAVRGTVAGVDYAGVVSTDRSVSSYLARVGDALVVTNSLSQLERIGRVHAGELKPLTQAPEYVFFRDRYPRGVADESGFLVLTDATIRRWCSPRWRIGASRRTLAAALMADAEAELLVARAEGRESVIADVADIGLVRERDGVRSEQYGSLEFLTPIVELDLDRVSQQEQFSYQQFRERYQWNWRAWFDPIAVRISVAEGVLDADVSVMPLIAGSDYNEMIEMCSGVALDPHAGDPHASAIAHWAMAIQPKILGRFTGLGSMVPELGVEPFNWMGGAISVYAEDDPFWEEWTRAKAENEEDLFFEDEFYRLPVVLHVPVRDPLRLAAFLTTLRAFAGQAAAGLVVWETRQHGELPYVRISPTPASGLSDGLAEVGLCYAALPDALIVTLREDCLQRALDRRGAPAEKKHEWLGLSHGLRIDHRFIAFLTAFSREEQLERMQLLSWSNLPALNAWRRELREDDALAFHERAFGVSLHCPGGGEYVWNETWQTYESTVYGHPAEPRAGPSLPPAALTVLSAELGLTFEEGGLRSRARIVRGTH